MSVLVSTLSKSQGNFRRKASTSILPLPKAAKMQHCFVHCLMAFLVVLAACFTRTASGITVFDVLSNVDTIRNPKVVVEPADSLNVQEPPLPVEAPKKTRRKAVFRKFVKVDLDQTQEHITLEEGQSFVMTCVVKSNPQATVQWVRGHNLNEEIRKLTQKSVSSYFSDYTEGRLVGIDAKYVIDCASNKDAGPLHCVAIAGDKVEVQTRIITIVESNDASRECSAERKPVITKRMNSIFSLIGSTIWLPCEAEGVPRPKTQWVDMNGTEIDNNYDPRYRVLPGGELLIEKLAWSDMGGPICVAKSSDDRSDFSEVFIYPLKRN